MAANYLRLSILQNSLEEDNNQGMLQFVSSDLRNLPVSFTTGLVNF